MTDGIAEDRTTSSTRCKAGGHRPFRARVPEGHAHRRSVLEGFDEKIGQTVTVAGRLSQIRDFGKLRFSHLADRSGSIQIGFQRDRQPVFWPTSGPTARRSRATISSASPARSACTKKGEKTIWATEVTLATKALRPAPEKWHGLQDQEQRYRMRYVDLFANPEVREAFALRSRSCARCATTSTRSTTSRSRRPSCSRSSAAPPRGRSRTHHNALDMPLFLRIAPELYLKRLIVGGMERVYEVGRVFRNEGISTRHNPEFTMLESYEAWADYKDIMDRVEGLFAHLVDSVLGGDGKVTFREQEYDLKPPFERARYLDLFAAAEPRRRLVRPRQVLARAKELNLKTDDIEPAKLANDVFEATVEDGLTGPVFVHDYPVAISPLAKRTADDPRVARALRAVHRRHGARQRVRELNDPIDQEQRFESQVHDKDDETPGEVDVDYVTALEHGMPPAGGLGIGIDRLCMLICGTSSIRDVVLFRCCAGSMRPRRRRRADGGGRRRLRRRPAPRRDPRVQPVPGGALPADAPHQLLGALGVAFAVWAMLIVDGVFTGFVSEIRARAQQRVGPGC